MADGATIKDNIAAVRERIAKAAERAGRPAEEIVLVAVTKTHPAEEILAAISGGATDVGENKVQEIRDKYDPVMASPETVEKTSAVKWHMIGHLQRNKVKYIIDKVALIHSVDSLRLAEEINARAADHKITMDVLIQVNVAREESKFGVGTEEVPILIREILSGCANIRIKGIMTIAPVADDPEDARGYFAEAKKLFELVPEKIKDEKLDFKYLSMGMTHDFEVAIEEGANMVRVGTAIFGPRNYPASSV
jgi:pyridoxal phosphate enzyme (YggS family)